jgi:hypothetical protein
MQNLVRILLTVLLGLALGLWTSEPTLANNSTIQWVNIDAQINVSRQQAVVVPLQPGSYKVHIIGKADGGKFDAFNLNCSSLGCKADGTDCRKGWQHRYSIYANRLIQVDRTDQYATPKLAIQHPPMDQFLEITKPTPVYFYIYNPSSPANNQGGLSLTVELRS